MVGFSSASKGIREGGSGGGDDSREPKRVSEGRAQEASSQQDERVVTPSSSDVFSDTTECSSLDSGNGHEGRNSRESEGEQETSSSQPSYVQAIPISRSEHLVCRRLLGHQFDDHKVVAKFEVLGSSVTLLKKERKGSSILQYIASGTMPISAESLVALNIDNDYRAVWDESALETKGITKIDEYTEALYSVTKYPTPLSKRDYVFHRRVLQSENGIILASTAASTPAVPEAFRRVRIRDFQSVLVIRPVCYKSCTLTMLYFEDPRSFIPSFVINWLTATALPAIVRKTIEAAARYPQDRLARVLKDVPRLDIRCLLSLSEPALDTAEHYPIYRGFPSLQSHLYDSLQKRSTVRR